MPKGTLWCKKVFWNPHLGLLWQVQVLPSMITNKDSMGVWVTYSITAWQFTSRPLLHCASRFNCNKTPKSVIVTSVCFCSQLNSPLLVQILIRHKTRIKGCTTSDISTLLAVYYAQQHKLARKIQILKSRHREMELQYLWSEGWV